jgi:probable F420-dependent oxidoreductase
MKVGLIPAAGGTFPTDPLVVTEVAQAAEANGFDSIWVGEHVVMSPREAYPGADQNRLGPSPTGSLPDPLDWLTFAAAVTDTILLGTCILILPLHNPLILAKRLATIDQLSGGRMRLGTGVGWSEDEYRAVGVDFRSRGRRCDEAIDAMRALWTNELASHNGAFFSFPPVHSFPQPVDHTVPIWVGGDSEAAARRAGRRGDGYFPFGKDPARLRELVEVARHAAEDAGRDPDALELTCLGSRHRHIVEQNVETGFTRMALFLPEATRAGVARVAEQAAEVTDGL